MRFGNETMRFGQFVLGESAMHSIKGSCGLKRRGSAVVTTAISLTALIGFAALAVDVGMLYNVRNELQRTADAAAMAGAAKLLDNGRFKEYANPATTMTQAAQEAASYITSNKIQNQTIQAYSGDVTAGYLNNPDDLNEALDTSTPVNFNSVRVFVARNAQKNGSVGLWFGRIFGLTSANLSASATATFKDGVVGYKVTDKTGNAGILPLALHVNSWNQLVTAMKQSGGTDNYTYHADTKTITAGGDGIPELNLYPGSGVGQLPPGNFGTVDIGSPNNSTADLARQIRYGVSESDLAWFGGELKLGADGTLLLNGDTGLSAGIKDDLESIKGQPRTIPLFNKVTGPGNNAMFTVVGFAGIRIMNVKLTGSMNSKNVIIQPAFVVENAAITQAGSGNSYFVYQPVRLTR